MWQTEENHANQEHPPYREGATVVLQAQCITLVRQHQMICTERAALAAKRAYWGRRRRYALHRVPLLARIIWWWVEEG